MPFAIFIKRILLFPFTLIAAIILVLEDWLWDDLQRLAAWVGSWPIFRQIETFIVALPPWGALAIFLVPSVILVPIKILALWFISRGHAALGIVTIIGAKIAGTALVARLFTLTKPKLMQFAWFSAGYEKVSSFKLRIYTYLKSTQIYTLMQEAKRRILAALKN